MPQPDPWTRTETPGAGRSLCNRPRRRDRVIITTRPGGYRVSMSVGTIDPSAVALGDALMAWGRPVPTDDDLEWLRGGP